MRRLMFCGLALSLLGLAAGCQSTCGCGGGCGAGGGRGLLGGHQAGVCDCGEAPVQPIIQPYGVNSGPPIAIEGAKAMPSVPNDKQ
jgi:hypothetical protein